jgi:hypothetical protein
MTIQGWVDENVAGLKPLSAGIGILLECSGKNDGGVGMQMPVSWHILDGRQTIQAEANVPVDNIRFHVDRSNPVDRRAERTPG